MLPSLPVTQTSMGEVVEFSFGYCESDEIAEKAVAIVLAEILNDNDA